MDDQQLVADYDDYKQIVQAKLKDEGKKICYCCGEREAVIELPIDEDETKDIFCEICAGLAIEKQEIIL